MEERERERGETGGKKAKMKRVRLKTQAGEGVSRLPWGERGEWEW